jgi:Ricin-type beta-trefoil lectin domain
VSGIRRLRAAATVGVLAAVTFGMWSGVRPAAVWAGSAPTIGPVQISALGRPGLCWETGSNGSAVTLEHCDAAVQGQQWSLTGNGVVMNGNGYCLEAQPGQAAGQALYGRTARPRARPRWSHKPRPAQFAQQHNALDVSGRPRRPFLDPARPSASMEAVALHGPPVMSCPANRHIPPISVPGALA